MNELANHSRASSTKPRRLLWIVNHRTLMPAEVPILRSLGWEVFIPKIIPDHDKGYRSGAISYAFDAALGLPSSVLRVLNQHDFYQRSWSSTIEEIVNQYFGCLVSQFSFYTRPLSEAARKFQGRIVARVFGREHPRTYTELAEKGPHKHLLDELAAVGDRFIFGQSYANLADVERPELRSRAYTITVPLPEEFYLYHNCWRGGGTTAVFLCPAISPNSYYGNIYEGIKRDFAQLPQVLFGRQLAPIDDPSVLPYLTDAELVELYATAPVFVYPHTEPRHVHYSPLEAMVVGTPTLYLRGALIDMLVAGANLPGACDDVADMRCKAQRLLDGDRALAEAIRSTQMRILDAFAPDLARRQWAVALPCPSVTAT